MTFPTVHINGTSRDELLRSYESAYNAVQAAIAAVIDSGPHARDYYVQGPDAFTKASNEHCDRITRLADVRNELLVLLEAVANA